MPHQAFSSWGWTNPDPSVSPHISCSPAPKQTWWPLARWVPAGQLFLVQNWTPYSRHNLMSARELIFSQVLLATVLSIQPKMWLTTFHARASCCPLFDSSSTAVRSFSAKLKMEQIFKAVDFESNPKENYLIFSSCLQCLHFGELISSVNIPISH